MVNKGAGHTEEPVTAPSGGDGATSGGAPNRALTAQRTPSFLLARPERRLLQAIARRLPAFVLPDHLTALGVVSALGTFTAYVLSNQGRGWLWVASALLVVHWLGDSLDGTLARVRRIERPRYGYYLDHLVDAGSTVAVGIGLGLSPYMLLSVGALIVVAYLVLSINVYLESYALERFSIGYARLGPTEVRILLVAVNTWLALGPQLHFSLLGFALTPLDVLGLGLAGTMMALVVGRARHNLAALAKAEPASRHRGDGSMAAAMGGD
ncbi:MAG: CDP-alcohol phosphatidyltransferase family protein [Actinomycetota bacterium]|nr:CDP-alcohol phosphatidyltransferase family protein [Actinomycetota bacterium]